MDKEIYRTIDANYNRAKEGLRVSEDIARFILNDKQLTKSFKDLRHSITSALDELDVKQEKLLGSRSTGKDVGKKSSLSELNKRNVTEIFFANLQRAKESLRVLEEFSKLINKKKSIGFKSIRYKIYDLEKKTFKKISSLSNHRQGYKGRS